MKEEQYKFLSDFFTASKSRSNLIKALHDILPAIMIVFYPLQLIYLLVNVGFSSEAFLKATFVPLSVLIVVTIMRRLINTKRPYEVYDYTPAVDKGTKGRSFPSRHTASAFIIAMAFLYLDVKIGVVMLVLATVIGITRVLSGVHFVRDVVFGAILSILVGIVFFFLL